MANLCCETRYVSESLKTMKDTRCCAMTGENRHVVCVLRVVKDPSGFS